MDALDGLPNPFHKTIVADPWQSNADDVPEIHGEAYRLCQRRLNDVIRDGGTRSIVLYGEAGSGKTHLLRRLRAQWLGEPPHEVDPIRPEVVFVSARLQTSPHHLWRYLRKSLVDDLLRQSSDGSSQLEGILLRRLAEVRGADADLRLWFEWLRDSHSAPGEFESTLNDLIDQVNLQARLGHDLWVVLVHLLLGRHRREATAWLRGDPLPSQALDRLGLAPEPSDSEPEDQARVTVAALCRLAGRKVPVVFCFDQIEALQVDRSDVAALFAFGRMVMELFQETENVLILACVQISFIDVLREAVLKPAWDRLAMERLAIAPLRWEEASKLIVSRLDAPPALRSLRQSRRDQPLWPLDPDRLKIRIGGAETARRILGECADQFEALQLGRQPDRPTTPDLSDSWRERLEVARRTYDPDQIPLVLEHALPMLLMFVAPDWARSLD
ncbi:MAG: ATP-binding protein, partial [Isosphaeraceae bacterium]